MSLAALMMTSAEALEPCLTELRERLGVEAEVASSRRAALQALSRREYAVLLLDQAMVEADMEGAELLWKQAGLAIPVQVNLALSSPARIVRDVRAALVRREQEMALSLRAAAAAVDTEIKNAVTALLLQSQLALNVEGLAPAAREKLAQVVQLAEGLRGKLETAQA
jgi:DNA-binding NtrC family response regulator|uniref:ANTAR domain-containing protein n=1 Tax=Acidobacterium capsulatum TaxID=33075 RepID=A0A7V4XSF4_9BACT